MTTLTLVRRPGSRTNPDCTAARHGDEAAYTRNGCRCPEAREDRRIRCKRRKHGLYTPPLTDSTGTARRIQGMAVQGWSYRLIGPRLGWGWQFVQKLADRYAPTVYVDTAERVAALASDLGWRPGPSARTRKHALAKGWLPLGVWPDGAVDDPEARPEDPIPDGPEHVDWVKVERALAGHAVGLFPLETHYAVHAGRSRGWSYTQIAKALRLSGSRTQELGAKPLPEGCEVAA